MNSDQYRILTPSEYEALLDAIEKERLRIIIETLLNTGMRYRELEEFGRNEQWFDAKNRAISLPAVATKTFKPRVIHLTPAFSKRLYQYLREHKELGVPTAQAMNTNLKRWWTIEERNWWRAKEEGYKLEPHTVEMHEYLKSIALYPTCKTFRKTWESWLLAAEYPSMAVALSQGHSELIAYKHYATLDPRLKSEMDKVREHTKGWGQ